MLILSLQTNQIHLCSNGDEDKTSGSFGAVITNNDSVLITLKGRAFGFKPGSYRAEVYGILALLHGLFHFDLYHSIDISSKLFLYCDNKSFIN